MLSPTCRLALMIGLTVVPQSAPCTAPPVGSGPRPLAPAGPHLPSGGGSSCLGCEVLRVTAGQLPPPGGWAMARVWTGLCTISSLEALEN